MVVLLVQQTCLVAALVELLAAYRTVKSMTGAIGDLAQNHVEEVPLNVSVRLSKPQPVVLPVLHLQLTSDLVTWICVLWTVKSPIGHLGVLVLLLVELVARCNTDLLYKQLLSV